MLKVHSKSWQLNAKHNSKLNDIEGGETEGEKRERLKEGEKKEVRREGKGKEGRKKTRKKGETNTIKDIGVSSKI